MNLIEGPLEPYFHGVLGVGREADGVRPRRMTAAQLAYFEQQPNWGIRARCPAGATLVLLTDSRWLDLELTLVASCRKYLAIDVEIDGALSHEVRAEPTEQRFRVRLFELPERRPREIHVYLPFTFDVQIVHIGLEDDATVEPLPRRPLKLLCLGDSITQGMDAASAFSPYPTQLGRLLNAEILNQGVGGHIFDAESLDPQIAFEPDVVTVAYGTNDWGRDYSAEAFRAVVRAYLDKLRAVFPPARIAAISPTWRAAGHEVRNGLDLPGFSQIILSEAVRVGGLIAIDGLELVPHQECYYVDGTHPNDTGMLHYALNLHRLLRARM